MIVFAKAQPTPAQAEAGNYRKKHVRFQGLAIAIENPKGSVRRGKDRGGHEWSVKMSADYGYVNGSMGVDGDQVDVYIGPDNEADTAYIVTTMAPPDFAKRDENKCMLGYASEAEAKAAFLAHYDNPKFFGSILAMPMDEFKAKVRATKDAPKFIKGEIMLGNAMVLFLKSSVGPYMRNGKMVNLNGYHGRDKKAAPPPGQMALFPAPEKKPMGPSPFSEDHMKNPEKHTPDLFGDADEHGEVPPGKRVYDLSGVPESELRDMWRKTGVPKDRQDELIRQIADKAKSGAKVGPFTVGGDGMGGFKKRDLGDGGFELHDGNMIVTASPTGEGKYQASHRSARSSPHLRGIEGVVAWASNIREDSKRAS